jgi:hypothetical protein
VRASLAAELTGLFNSSFPRSAWERGEGHKEAPQCESVFFVFSVLFC